MGSILLVGTAESSSGGPDSYGYVWVDNQPPSPTVAYAWVDIVPTGTRLTLPDEGCTFEVNIGFQFRFYGTITDYLYVCSNGFITFSVPDSYSPDPPIPSTQPPNNRIVALGMDLNPAASGGVYFLSQPSTTPRRFILTWNAVYKTYTTRPETFQIILEQNETTKDGRIFLQYKTLNDVPPVLVGIENRTGTSGLTYPKPLMNSLAVAFLPPSDAELPPDTLRVTATTLAPSVVEQGTVDVPMLRLDLSTATNWIDVASFRVVLSGLGAGPEDVSRARLWFDDGDGVLEPSFDLLVATSFFSGVPPTAYLQPVSLLRVSTTTSPRLFLTYDVAPTAGIGDWIGARLPDATHVSVLFPDVVNAGDFPIETYAANVRTLIAPSRDTLTVARASSLLPANVSQWSTDVPAMRLQLVADRNLVEIAGLNVSLGGNATAADAWLLKAVEDRDGDGNYTQGTDAILAIAAPSGTPPRANLAFALQVVARSPRELIVFLDVGPGATPGHVMNLTVNAADFALPPGSADVIAGTNLPASTGNRTVVEGTRPALQLPWVDGPTSADGVWFDDEHPAGPANTALLDRPIGNHVPGLLTAQNNATTLFLAIDSIRDSITGPGDGVAIGFDRNLDGVPTNNSDDVFVMNASAGGHYLYNTTAGTWTLAQVCSSGTVPTCATGFGRTPFERSSHRFYEFEIPLALLGAAPGGTLRFAVASPPYFGLADGGNRSTWPLVFGPATPSLAYFGELLLAPGPLPNRPPMLDWTGEPGYVANGLDPEWGLWNATFHWRILYTDPDDDPPAVSHPLLHLYNDGLDLAISPLALSPVDPTDRDYTDGNLYFLNLGGLPCGANLTYSFEVRDARGLRNATGVYPGPQVLCPDLPPSLAGEAVSPFVGTAAQTVFTYRVVYSDLEGLPPDPIELFVRRDGTVIASPVVQITGWIGDIGDYAAGALYTGSFVFAEPGTNYTFQFRAADRNTTVETAPLLGPYVIPPPPDVLVVAGVDLAPLIVDEGSGHVPFLGLLLLTSTDVNVTSVRVDRIGSVGDTEVPAVHLYLDVDGTRTLTPGDVPLGVRQPVLGTATFPVSLRVTSATSVSLLFLVNLTKPGTPDGTVGLEIRDASYITVSGGDVVSSFPAYRSTRALINVPPAPANPTVDGYGTGTPGIQHITSDAPAFAWRFADPNSADVAQAAFNVSVSPGPTSPPLWYRNETGGTSTIPYAGPALTDGTTYLLRIAVFDGRLWSAAVQVFFRMNTPPAAPTPLSPTDFATDVSRDVTLLWQPVVDGDGDSITYTYWIADNPTFLPALQDSTPAPGVSLSLSPATTYYWKIGASDGFEFAGNGTVWRFTTIGGGPGPVRGEVRGRVVNGTAPLPQALVEVLVGTQVVAATLTDANGVFSLRDLDLGVYTVRLSAFGFHPTTRTAAPTESDPVVDLGDVALVPYAPPDGDGGPIEIVSAVPLPIVVLVLIALVLSATMLLMSLRGRRNPGRGEEDRSREGETPDAPDSPSKSTGPEDTGETNPPEGGGSSSE